MEDLHDQLEILTEDFQGLSQEMMMGLGGDSWVPVPELFEQAGYFQQLDLIRMRIFQLMDRINSRLGQLQISFGRGGEGDGIPMDDAARQRELDRLANLKSQLLALWERFESLLSLIEQKEAAQPTGLGAMVNTAKSWAATLGAWIKRVCSQLWQMIGQLLTPREWKLTGKVGTGLLGLADAGVEITFGPAASSS